MWAAVTCKQRSVILIRMLLPLCFLWLKHFLSWFSYHCSVLQLPPFLCSFFWASFTGSSSPFFPELLVFCRIPPRSSLFSYFFLQESSPLICVLSSAATVCISQDLVRFYCVSLHRGYGLCFNRHTDESWPLLLSPLFRLVENHNLHSLHCVVLSAPKSLTCIPENPNSYLHVDIYFSFQVSPIHILNHLSLCLVLHCICVYVYVCRHVTTFLR